MLTAGAAALLAALGLVSPPAAGAATASTPDAFTETAQQQIAALQAVKTGRSAAESKVDSKLLVAEKGVAKQLTALQSGAAVSSAGTVLVDIRASKVSPDLIASLTKAGAGIRAVSDRYASVRAEVPLNQVTAIAARGDVKRVEQADQAMTARELATPATTPAKTETKQQKADRIAGELQKAVSAKSQRSAAAAATLTSEGDRAHNADLARQQFGVTGVGVKACALSDGVDSLASSVAKGELPPDVDVIAGQEGDGDEGTAMLEIIHDLAPNAKLGFASAFNSDASFADNIRKLRFESHCDVIVDDVIYFKESPFQDWIIAQAVNDVTANGALYFSSAGNEGNVADGTAGHWEGDFVDSGKSVGKFAGVAHNFAGAAGNQIYEPISDASSAQVPVTLHWSDPLGASANDYDLYLLNSAGAVVSFSQNVQDGTQDPYEILQTPAFGGTGLRLAVVKFSGANRYLSLSALRGRFKDSADGLKAYNTPGVTVGHSAARDAFSVAATPAAAAFGRPLEPGDPANPTGPYPAAFSGASKAERFTSDGPRRVFYEADGTPITPGNVSSTGGEVRNKPEITAADGVKTSVTGFSPFFGTSAAAPHAGAIAALVLSGNPGLPPSEVREALINTAIDIETPGRDNFTGAGVILADKVLAYTGASPQPLAVAKQPTVTPADGGSALDPGDTAKVTLPVTNEGDGTAVSTSVVLTSPTPGVTVAPRSKSYGTISPGQTGVNDFTITVPATQQLGAPVVLNARVSFAGAHSPTTSTFSLPVGTPSPVAQDFAYTGAPVAIPDNSPVGASVTIPVTGVGRASKVAFSVDGATCSTDPASTTVGLNHSYVGDLVGTLTAPSGAKATVFQRNGGSGKNLCQVVFADTAAAAFSTVTSANAPFTGTWRPTQALTGNLTGAAVDGTWTFAVVDAAGGDVGSIRSVALHINGFVQPPAAGAPSNVRGYTNNGPVHPL
ncbi:Proprotein convertase P-domain-containing protein [Amycolatopsis pretoriensis]|uniref:Proprotein convertase P-domain-containing protein n=1 Tax=Amycolatopsis pretoriensis TaxID=218821 RepID=A0A1H5RI03_9PSEU|nr:S8 family serine peptidase [Amycolatopsis pretoriensis]SEF37694.1 Proprotein convertase P-domain-containing protein [Amycolatopsis pretoriensis]